MSACLPHITISMQKACELLIAHNYDIRAGMSRWLGSSDGKADVRFRNTSFYGNPQIRCHRTTYEALKFCAFFLFSWMTPATILDWRNKNLMSGKQMAQGLNPMKRSSFVHFFSSHEWPRPLSWIDGIKISCLVSRWPRVWIHCSSLFSAKAVGHEHLLPDLPLVEHASGSHLNAESFW